VLPRSLSPDPLHRMSCWVSFLSGHVVALSWCHWGSWKQCFEVAFFHQCWEILRPLWVLDLPRNQRSVIPVKKRNKQKNLFDPSSSALQKCLVWGACEESVLAYVCGVLQAQTIKIPATLGEIQVSSLIRGQIIFSNAHGKMFASCLSQ